MKSTITTAELFRLVSLSIGKEKPASAYKVAQVFQVSDTAARNWERGFVVMDESNAAKAAEMLGLDLEFVIFSLEAEKKGKSGLDKIAAIFERAALAAANHGQAASFGFAVALAFLVVGRAAAELCILCKTRYREILLRDWLLDLWDGDLPQPA